MKYEVTVSLMPQLYRFDCREQLKMTRDIIAEIMKPFDCSIVAELTNMHNIHYHCMVELQNMKEKNKLLNRFRQHGKVFGKKSCDQVRFENSYVDYMKEDMEKTREHAGDPIIRDFYRILGNLEMNSF